MAEGEYLPYPRLGSVACCRGSSRLRRGSVAAMLRLVAALSRLRRGSVAARRGSVAARCGRVAAPSQACRGCRAGVAQVSRRCRALSRCVAGMLQKNRLLSRFCCGVSLVSRAIFFLSKPRHVLGHPLEGGVCPAAYHPVPRCLPPHSSLPTAPCPTGEIFPRWLPPHTPISGARRRVLVAVAAVKTRRRLARTLGRVRGAGTGMGW